MATTHLQINSDTISYSIGCRNYDIPLKCVRISFMVQAVALLVILSLSFYVCTYAPLWAQVLYAGSTLTLVLTTAHTLNKLQERFRFLWD